MSNEEHGILRIGKPYIESDGETAFLKADISENQTQRILFFSVDASNASGLTDEVADCFVVALLPHAMMGRLDIISEAPVSRPLLYSLKKRLIPELDECTERYHSISITATPDDRVFPERKGVGMGWSGGVDSVYTFLNTYKTEEPGHALTHLVNINAGVFEGSAENILWQFRLNSENLKETGKENGLKALDISSNIHLELDENYLSVCTFRLCSAVLALQKLFSVYYLSSGYEFSRFSFDENNSAYYDFVLCSSFSTQNLRFYNIGCEVSRIEKIRAISDSPFAQKHLHVCVRSSRGNCLRCGKCVRTVAALHALGKLENFSSVFDLGRLEREMDEILGDLYYHRKSLHYREVLNLMEEKGIRLSPRALRYAAFLETATHAAERHQNELTQKKPLQDTGLQEQIPGGKKQ